MIFEDISTENVYLVGGIIHIDANPSTDNDKPFISRITADGVVQWGIEIEPTLYSDTYYVSFLDVMKISTTFYSFGYLQGT